MQDISSLLPDHIRWEIVHPNQDADRVEALPPVLVLSDWTRDRHVDIYFDDATSVLSLVDLNVRVIEPALAALAAV